MGTGVLLAEPRGGGRGSHRSRKGTELGLKQLAFWGSFSPSACLKYRIQSLPGCGGVSEATEGAELGLASVIIL